MSEFKRIGAEEAVAVNTTDQEVFLWIKEECRNEEVAEGGLQGKGFCFVCFFKMETIIRVHYGKNNNDDDKKQPR